MALEHIKTLERAKKKKQTDVVAALRDRALEYAREGKIEQAIRYLETYSGELASETSRERLSMANQLRGKLRAKEAEGMKRAEERVAAVERRLSEAMDRVASELVASGIPAARTALNEAARDPDLKEKAKDLAAIQELFDRAENIDRRVLSSFQAQRGQTVAVELKTGRKMFHITEAEGNRITYEVRSGAGMASVSMSFGLDDLAPRERLGRMGDDSLPDVALVKGLMALQGGVSAHARKYLAMTPPLLSARLLASVDAAGQKAAEAKAEDALREMLKDFGIAVSAGFDAAAWVHAVENAAFTREKAARLGPALELFRQDHGATYFAQRASAVIEALDQIRNDAGPAVSVENRSSD
jgi:hypothetical protein